MADITLITKHFLALYFLFIGIHYASTAIGLHQRTGRSSIEYGKLGSVTWWVRMTFNFFRAAILIVCMTRVFYPIDPYLGIFQNMMSPAVMVSGMVLMLISLGFISFTHAYMRQNWRSGISKDPEPVLLQKGPFSRSRNPMFIAIMLGQLGFFLALPSVFTLVCLATGIAMMVTQAYKEETALAAQFGADYTDYKARIPRWL